MHRWCMGALVRSSIELGIALRRSRTDRTALRGGRLGTVWLLARGGRSIRRVRSGRRSAMVLVAAWALLWLRLRRAQNIGLMDGGWCARAAHVKLVVLKGLPKCQVGRDRSGECPTRCHALLDVSGGSNVIGMRVRGDCMVTV